MTLNKFAFRRIVLLLICPALLITLIGNAVALDSVQDPAIGEQTQSADISFTGSGGTTYNLDQDQSAAITSGDGVINQYQQSSGTVSTNGMVTIGTATGSEVQNVYTTGSSVTPGTDSSATPTSSNVVSTDSRATPTSNVVSTGPGAVIAGSSDASTSNVVKIISTPTDVGGSIQASQGPTVESGVDISQQQTGSLMTIQTPKRNIGIIRLQQK
jgi:hypothetical protein